MSVAEICRKAGIIGRNVMRPEAVVDAALDIQARFTGHIDDSATGLTCMQARCYDPAIGRFLSMDPVVFRPRKRICQIVIVMSQMIR